MPGYHPGAMLARRAAFARIGPLREDLQAGEFIEWYARATDGGLRVAMLAQTVMRRRLHEANHGRTMAAAYDKDYLRLLRGVIQRRRGSG
jgi:hypothetical protein